MNNSEKNNDSKFKWEQQELPRAYLRLEGILYQTAWVIQQELKRQTKAMENVKKVIETSVRDPNTWKK